jgi:hypothetical protein
MSGAFTVHGADRLQATLHQAGVELGDLEAAHKRAGETIMAATRPRTPVRTGRLVSSLATRVAAAGVQVYADAPYAVYVHAADPFLITAAKAVEPTVLGFYADAAQAAIDKVAGA